MYKTRDLNAGEMMQLRKSTQSGYSDPHLAKWTPKKWVRMNKSPLFEMV
jgi:hypothetical protein